MFHFVESWWPLGASDPVTIDDVIVGAESAFWIWEDINEVLHTITSDLHLGTAEDWTTSWENRLNKESVITLLVSLSKVLLLPFIFYFSFKTT